MKAPLPEPFVVFVVRLTVGLVDVDQTTPLAVTFAPPLELMLPPDDAVVLVTFVIAVVVRVGITAGRVVKLNSVPYDTPA